ncbi:hypothetical protein NCC49_001453 [Naganishia albida]|nr:hypothetical protein NCC49_001453 [Naganishia albida]
MCTQSTERDPNLIGNLLLKSRRPVPESRRRQRSLHQQPSTLLETVAGEDPKELTSFRRHEDRAPPHLPLPPTLPYQPTSMPFRRHLQILEESLLSSSAEPSWEIFEALHEDLRRRHLPPDTLRAILGKQVEGIAGGGAGKRQARQQWKKIGEVLGIVNECRVRAQPEDLERIIIAGLDAQGKRTAGKYLGAEQLEAVWDSLVALRSGQLDSISLSVRERWLLFRISRAKKQRTGGANRGEIAHDVQSDLRVEWRRLASQGFFKGIRVSTQLLQAFQGDYLVYVKDIIETLRSVYRNGAAVPLEAVQFVWGNHLEERITSFEPPDPGIYRFIADSLGAPTPLPGSFDALSRDALQYAITRVTGNVQEAALSLYLPSDQVTTLTDDKRSVERALHTARRRIKHIPTQPTVGQTPTVVTSLGFGALLVKEAATRGHPIPENYVTVIFRGFKYLPARIRGDERYAPRLHSALVLLVRSLREQDRSLKRWMDVWPVMLDALAGYVAMDPHGRRDVLPQAMFLYRQARRRKCAEHLDGLSLFRGEVTPKVLDFPWLALELFVDHVASSATEGVAPIRAAIVFRIATINNPRYLRRLRHTIEGYLAGGDEDATVLGIVYDAVSTCESPQHALALYEMVKDRSPSAEGLARLLRKVQELGTIEQRQRAIDLVGDAYGRGVRLSRDGMEALVRVLDGQASGMDVDGRVRDVEEALRSDKRLFVRGI